MKKLTIAGLGLLGLLGFSRLIESQERPGTEKSNLEKVVHINYRNRCGASGLAAGHFDKDKYPDLAVGDMEGVSIYKGTSNPTVFVYSSNLYGGKENYPINSRDKAGASGLAAADLNIDGLDDLVVKDVNGVRVWYNEKGKFRPEEYISTNRNCASSLAFGDYDGDGKKELLIGDSKLVYIFKKEENSWKKTGSVVIPETIFSRDDKLDGAGGLAFGNFNNKSSRELAVGDMNFVRIFEIDKELSLKNYVNSLNSFGVPSFTIPQTSKIGEGGSCGLASGDFNRDGYTDLIIGDVNGHWLFTNNQGKGFNSPKLISFQREK